MKLTKKILRDCDKEFDGRHGQRLTINIIKNIKGYMFFEGKYKKHSIKAGEYHKGPAYIEAFDNIKCFPIQTKENQYVTTGMMYVRIDDLIKYGKIIEFIPINKEITEKFIKCIKENFDSIFNLFTEKVKELELRYTKGAFINKTELSSAYWCQDAYHDFLEEWRKIYEEKLGELTDAEDDLLEEVASQTIFWAIFEAHKEDKDVDLISIGNDLSEEEIKEILEEDCFKENAREDLEKILLEKIKRSKV